jgi:hypothetical protein
MLSILWTCDVLLNCIGFCFCNLLIVFEVIAQLLYNIERCGIVYCRWEVPWFTISYLSNSSSKNLA